MNGDVVRFSDGDDTIIFNINDDYYTTDFYIEKYSDDDCRSEAKFNSDNSNILELSLSGESLHYGDFVNYRYAFHIPENDSMRFVYDDFYFQCVNGECSFSGYDEYTAGDKTYTKVLLLTEDTIGPITEHEDYQIVPTFKKPQIWRITIADSVGLIQFEDRVNHKTWNLVDRGHVEPMAQ